MKEVFGTRLYDMKEVGQLLGVTSQTVAKYIKEGRLSARAIGKRYFVSEDDLRKFVSA